MRSEIEDRWLDAMLPEALGEIPPDLADDLCGLAGATEAERARATLRVKEARDGSRGSGRMVAAAVLCLGGLAVAFAAWTGAFGGGGAIDDGGSRHEEPQDVLVVPKDTEEFLALLAKVESVSVRALHLTSSVTRNRNVSLLATDASITLPAARRDAVVSRMRKAARAGMVPGGRRVVDKDPDVRVTLRLNGGKRVECLFRSQTKTWSVLPHADYGSGQAVFREFARAFVESSSQARHALGIVGSPIELKAPRAARFSKRLSKVRLLSGFGDKDLPLVEHFERIVHLDLSCSRMSHRGFRDWAPGLRRALRDVEILELGTLAMDDAVIEFLASNLPKLRRLDLAAPPPRRIEKRAGPTEHGSVTGEGFGAFATHGKLENLNLRGQEHLTDAGLARIVAIPSLRHLDLSYVEASSLTRKGYAVLRRAVQLRTLRIPRRTASTIPPAYRTGDILESIDALPRLEELSLARSNVDDTGIARLRTLPSLLRLDLSLCLEIGDASLSHVARRLKAIRSIDLRGAHGVTAIGVKELLRLSDLRVVRLTRSLFSVADAKQVTEKLGDRVHWDR